MSAMTPQDFYRESTRIICSDLSIEQGMRRCLTHLRQYMPADHLILNTYHRSSRTMHTIAMATPESCERTLLITKVPRSDREAQKNLPKIRIANHPLVEPIDSHMAEFLGIPNSSLLLMFLYGDGEAPQGHLALAANGVDYSQAHLELFQDLREPFSIALANTLKHDALLAKQRKLVDDNRFLSAQLRNAEEPVIGADFGLRGVMEMVRQVAPRGAPVLLLGEAGVGKDIIANAVHELSPRRDQPFIKVNCGAIANAVVDSELFGHEKGAFSDAISQKRGRFERADTGTIFLDEIADLTPAVQLRLLRVLQNQEIERVGGSQTIHVDIRVVAATHQNLEKKVEQGSFREDLWFRLAMFPIEIPPLRQRPMDIPQLVHHILEQKRAELRLERIPDLQSGTMDHLLNYSWPGNVRELENLIERALIVNPQGPISLDPRPQASQGPYHHLSSKRFDDVMKYHIEQVLEKTNGKIHGPGGAAQILDINPGTLRNRMKKLGIIFGRAGKTSEKRDVQ